MDDMTRSKALLKVDKLHSTIAYAAEILDDKKIEKFYKGLVLKSYSYIGNFLNLIKWTTAYTGK